VVLVSFTDHRETALQGLDVIRVAWLGHGEQPAV
jgi:hypothetical protein